MPPSNATATATPPSLASFFLRTPNMSSSLLSTVITSLLNINAKFVELNERECCTIDEPLSKAMIEEFQTYLKGTASKQGAVPKSIKPKAAAAATAPAKPKKSKLDPKVVEALMKPVDDDVVPTAAAAVTTTTCVARKVDEKEWLPGTDANKVFLAKSCSRKPAADKDLCAVCAKMEEKAIASNGKDKKWLGRMSDAIPDHLHIEGSAWFHETYPQGLQAPCEDNESIEECVLAEEEPVKEVVWMAMTYEGRPMMRNIKNGLVYAADITKVGEDRIKWDEFEGRWIDGDLDVTATEDDE